MIDEDIEKLDKINKRMLHILGVATVIILKLRDHATENENELIKWVIEAIENIVYLDKPLPSFPRN